MDAKIFKNRGRLLPPHANANIYHSKGNKKQGNYGSRSPNFIIGEEKGPNNIQKVHQEVQKGDITEQDRVVALRGEDLIDKKDRVEEVDDPPDGKGPFVRSDEGGVAVGGFSVGFSEDP